MGTIRMATEEDAELITAHRHWMFADNAFACEETLAGMDAGFEPWLRERIEDGRYVGLLMEEEGRLVAGAGVFFADFPPHWMDAEPVRAYVLNVYAAPEARGKGYAKRLMEEVLVVCRRRGVGVVTLHASPMGRPVYEAMGFVCTDEMRMRLGREYDKADCGGC